VIAVAIGLDHQTPISPEEVDEVGANANVDLRLGQVMAPAEPQEGTLEVAAGPVAITTGTDRQPEYICLADRSPELPGRNQTLPTRPRDPLQI